MSDLNANRGLAIVAGAGQGLGRRLMERFQAGGYATVGLVRTLPERRTGDLELVKVDLTRPDQTADAVQTITDRYGSPRVVIHNTADLVIAPFTELTVAHFERTWRNTALTAVNLAHATLPRMVDADGGVFLVSGATASQRGGSKFAAFASAKFALRGLAQSLAREFQPQGVHVAHVLLDGIIDTPKSRDLHNLSSTRMMKPDDIAEIYWSLAHQPRSTWTHELDLRPVTESF
jgi:NAD(P)-dependent dehydrogenase (short-subunit alcohol dehydrogenase family)